MDPLDLPDCRDLLVARNALGCITACASCGNLQLTLQCLTVRLEPAAFRELAALVTLAQQRLDRRGMALAGAPADDACVH